MNKLNRKFKVSFSLKDGSTINQLTIREPIFKSGFHSGWENVEDKEGWSRVLNSKSKKIDGFTKNRDLTIKVNKDMIDLDSVSFGFYLED